MKRRSGHIKRAKWEAGKEDSDYLRGMTDEAKYPFDRELARAGRYDGRFIVGVLSTGIYCLPSCCARPPKPENVRLFKTEEDAKQANLRACKRCRPDLYYRGENSDLSLFEGLIARVRKNPENFADTAALATAAGVSQTKLGELMRDHAHMAPAAWLRRERVKAACGMLFAGGDRIADIGFAVGFESESVFHRQFLTITRMTPGAWRALKDSSVFVLHLPAGWRAEEILGYHGRDPESLCERVEGRRLFKALMSDDGPVVLEIALEARKRVVQGACGARRERGNNGARTDGRVADAGPHRRRDAIRKPCGARSTAVAIAQSPPRHARAHDGDAVRRAVLGRSSASRST